jgi:hypothetical protein
MQEQTKPKPCFEELLLLAIDEALAALGENVKAATHSYLEKRCHLRTNEIAGRIGEFQSALEQLFGVGARYLEILIMKNFYAKTKLMFKLPELAYPTPTLTFQEYIKLMSRQIEETTAEKEKVEISPSAIKKQEQHS